MSNNIDKILLSIVFETKHKIDRKGLLTPLQLGDCVKDILKSEIEKNPHTKKDSERYLKDAYKIYFTPSTFNIR